MSEVETTVPAPQEWFCDQCGKRFPAPGVCDGTPEGQHPPVEVQPLGGPAPVVSIGNDGEEVTEDPTATAPSGTEETSEPAPEPAPATDAPSEPQPEGEPAPAEPAPVETPTPPAEPVTQGDDVQVLNAIETIKAFVHRSLGI